MFPRILDISDAPARLSVRVDQLVIGRGDDETCSIPLAETAVVVLAHPQVTLTQAVLAGLLRNGGVLVACDERRLPSGMMLPLAGNYVQAERMAAQARAKLPLRKRLWTQIVRQKIVNQASVLTELRQRDRGLVALIRQLRPGDPTNVEAQAARRYWNALFPGSDFHREREGDDQNRLLNYGYAVLRAIIARAISASGLHPSLGIHHRNRYNAFCLADDLIEPFRPAVDRVVARFVDLWGADVPLDATIRRSLLDALLDRWEVNGELRTLFDVAARLASSLADCYTSQRRELELPERLPRHADLRT